MGNVDCSSGGQEDRFSLSPGFRESVGCCYQVEVGIVLIACQKVTRVLLPGGNWNRPDGLSEGDEGAATRWKSVGVVRESVTWLSRPKGTG